MTEQTFYYGLVYGWIALSLVTCMYLFVRPAPYGRHGTAGWGPMVPARLGWFLMETPAALTIAIFFALRPPGADSPGTWVMLGLWELHYLNRAFVFPLQMKPGGRPMPIIVVLSAVFFNVGNGYLNGRGLTVFGPAMPSLMTTRIAIGACLFLGGMAINWQADATLRALRKDPSDSGYKIPRGGLYELISCPNYFGELIEWIGFAIAAGTIGAWTFVIWTAANLAPRAWQHHKWYRAQFPDYPTSRRALIPYIW